MRCYAQKPSCYPLLRETIESNGRLQPENVARPRKVGESHLSYLTDGGFDNGPRLGPKRDQVRTNGR